MNSNNNADNNIYIEAHCHETLEKQNKENVLKTVIGKTTWLLQRNRNQNSNENLKMQKCLQNPV